MTRTIKAPHKHNIYRRPRHRQRLRQMKALQADGLDYSPLPTVIIEGAWHDQFPDLTYSRMTYPMCDFLSDERKRLRRFVARRHDRQNREFERQGL